VGHARTGDDFWWLPVTDAPETGGPSRLTIVSLDPTGRGRRRWTNRWKAALNAFDITFDGRVSAAGK
jgi:hypothetical protein